MAAEVVGDAAAVVAADAATVAAGWAKEAMVVATGGLAAVAVAMVEAGEDDVEAEATEAVEGLEAAVDRVAAVEEEAQVQWQARSQERGRRSRWRRSRTVQPRHHPA